jgi:hypothetical protein
MKYEVLLYIEVSEESPKKVDSEETDLAEFIGTELRWAAQSFDDYEIYEIKEVGDNYGNS